VNPLTVKVGVQRAKFITNLPVSTPLQADQQVRSWPFVQTSSRHW